MDNFIPPIFNAIKPYIKSNDGQGILVKPKNKKIENNIMLTAKLAKADGEVTQDEIEVFKEKFKKKSFQYSYPRS